MFAPSTAIPRFGAWRPSRRATTIGTVVGHAALLVAFGIAGTVFFGLTVASSLGVGIAARQGIALSATDLAAAESLGPVWWLFAAGAALSFGAAMVTIGTLMRRLGARLEG